MRCIVTPFQITFFFVIYLIITPARAGYVPYTKTEALWDCVNIRDLQRSFGVEDFESRFDDCIQKVEKRFCTGQRKIPVQSFYEGIPMNDGKYKIEYFECPK